MPFRKRLCPTTMGSVPGSTSRLDRGATAIDRQYSGSALLHSSGLVTAKLARAARDSPHQPAPRSVRGLTVNRLLSSAYWRFIETDTVRSGEIQAHWIIAVRAFMRD